jgi:predicted metal-dependent peptidase
MAQPAHKIANPKDPWQNNKKTMEDFSKSELAALEDKVSQAMFILLLRHEFFGMVALRLRRVMTTNVKSGAVDGRTLFFNPGFLEALTIQETVFLIAHETLHCVFEHFIRRNGRNPQWWNMAGDYVINYICKREGIGKLISNVLIDDKYANKTTEEIYDEFEKKAQEYLDTLDDHCDVYEQGESQDENGDSTTTFRKLTPEEAKEVGDQIKGSIIQAGKAAGNVPGEIRRLIDQFLNPKIRWQSLIEVSIASKERYDSSFSRPDRKSWSNASGVIFPGDLPGEQINVAIGLDNSGSFTEEMLRKSLSEVKGMMDSYNTFKIQIWCFDTQVSGYRVFTEDNYDELCTYEMTGGGGTAIACNWDYMIDNDIEADLFICFTDLYSSDLARINPNQIETVWVVIDNPTGTPPFGKYAHYEN